MDLTFEPGERRCRVATDRRARQTENIASVDGSSVNVAWYRRLLRRVYHHIHVNLQSFLSMSVCVI